MDNYFMSTIDEKAVVDYINKLHDMVNLQNAIVSTLKETIKDKDEIIALLKTNLELEEKIHSIQKNTPPPISLN